MKAKFTSLDIKLLVTELERKLLGMRVNNVYDIDSKTYLIKLNRTDEKAMLLLECGIRFHTTDFEWPKHMLPSGFAMKLRKHLKGRRLESVKQLGVDRIVDLQFGSAEAAYHIILEVYDRGNIVLTDHEYTILNIQRPRTDNDQDVKFIVKEKYPIHLAKQHQSIPSKENIKQILQNAKTGDNLRKILNPHLVYGSHLLDHSLVGVGLKGTSKLGTEFEIDRDLDKLMEALNVAEEFMQHCVELPQQGFIINQKETKPDFSGKDQEVVVMYSEFHPFLFEQHLNESYTEFESFDKAVDEFFSKIESQKQDRKSMQQKTAAMKKLEHIKSDNKNRIEGLKEEQFVDLKRAWLIELNLDLVEEVISMMRNALAHQLDWTELKTMVEEAASTNGVASSIKALKLDINHITMLLKLPEELASNDELNLSPMRVDIDLGLSGHANARKYYDMKKHAAVKENKTSDALQKAYKSVEKKTMQVIKEVQRVATINKARKTHWFEKFFWFISSENYIVIGGRDQQQNEMIVKRHLRPGDIYVHCDLHGASSIVIKNPTKKPVPPVTLNEAGTMALCHSKAWDAKVVTSSYWVYHDQVSKTAPTGEYLVTGSFMIRGKKNYLLPSSLICGFGFLFKLDESCLEKHKNERRIKGKNDDGEDDGDHSSSKNTQDDVEEEIIIQDDNDDDDDGGDDDVIASTGDGQQVVVTKPDGEEEDKGDDDDVGGDDDGDVGGGDDDGVVGDDDDDDDLEAYGWEVIKEENLEFPDTQIRLDHLTLASNDATVKDVVAVLNPRMSAKQRRDAKKGCVKDVPTEKVEDKATPPVEKQVQRRRHKGKLKKMKEKYKDQDEEEKEMRIQLLASNNAPKQSKKRSKLLAKFENRELQIKKQESKKQGKVKIEDITVIQDEFVIDSNQNEPIVIEEEELDDDYNKQTQQELEMLDSLTGMPLSDDVIHYCVAVCAPWDAIKNYKFKVKLTPGTSKRGKAAKTAITSFISDKNTTSLEKDLFRSLKDTDCSRNMPGKVKMSVIKPIN